MLGVNRKISLRMRARRSACVTMTGMTLLADTDKEEEEEEEEKTAEEEEEEDDEDDDVYCV